MIHVLAIESISPEMWMGMVRWYFATSNTITSLLLSLEILFPREENGIHKGG